MSSFVTRLPSPRPARAALAAVVAVFLLALGARWLMGDAGAGRQFLPRPDAVEYAAAAQAIAQSGTYYLQMGPERVRPRYPPGWPLALAVALRAGVPGEELWRVSGLFGAALAALLAALAAAAASRLTALLGGAAPPHPALAAAVAGGLWALCPLAVNSGRRVMSDEPATLAVVAALALTGIAFLGEGRGWRRVALAAAGGFALGAAAALRPIAAALALPVAVAFVAWGVWRERGAWRPALAWAAGAALLPLLTMALLLRSGRPPLEWSAYYAWVPEWYGSLARTFDLRYAVAGNPRYRTPGFGMGAPHLWVAARFLAGLPGTPAAMSSGWLWPLLGWLALALFAVRCRRGGGRAGSWLFAGALLGAWVLAQVAAYSAYFFPGGRFYLPALALAAVSLGAGVAVAAAIAPRAFWRRLAVAVGVAALLATAVPCWRMPENRGRPQLAPGRTRAAVARWLALGDEERARRTMPFDPLAAQALGLLDPATVASIGAWGKLPDTGHARRLNGARRRLAAAKNRTAGDRSPAAD